MILTIIVFLAVLSLLVLVHEFGHFFVARLAGIGVLEFALGLPFTKPIWSKKLKGGMKISLYPILFGGFVKLLGEESDENLKNSFSRQGVWSRIAVVVAGVTMNFILAIVLFYGFLALSNFKVLVPRLADYHFLSPNENRVVVTAVQDGSPAKITGLVPGDVILSADGKQFTKFVDFQTYTKSRAGFDMTLLVSDETISNRRTVKVTPRKNPPVGQGALGLGIADGIVVSFQTPQEKSLSGLTYAVDMLGYNLQVIGHLGAASFKSRDVAPLSENVSGPVGIAGAVGTILGLGGSKAIVAMLNFVGLLSLSLGFMNILPFPALDGGRLAFLLVEAFTGRKLAAKKENLINQIGMLALLGLIILISFNDLKRVFGK